VPVIAAEADPQTCSPYPFAHLRIGQRSALRAAYATLLKERVAGTAPPVKVLPPPVTDWITGANPLIIVEGGCLLCGVGHQMVPVDVVAGRSSKIISHLV
jgi:hypothetical protein